MLARKRPLGEGRSFDGRLSPAIDGKDDRNATPTSPSFSGNVRLVFSGVGTPLLNEQLTSCYSAHYIDDDGSIHRTKEDPLRWQPTHIRDPVILLR